MGTNGARSGMRRSRNNGPAVLQKLLYLEADEK